MIQPNDTDVLYGERASLPADLTELLPYSGSQFGKYRHYYFSAHGYISITLCLFGITANILNITALTGRKLISPINYILTGIAVADMMAMLSYIPFGFHSYLCVGLDIKDKYSFGWAVFAVFHTSFTVLNHTISTWLTLTVAVWRYMTERYPTPIVRWRSLIRAKKAITSTYIACTILCFPVYITFTVVSFRNEDKTLYRMGYSEIAKMKDMLLADIGFWIFEIIAKLVPCVTLIALSLGLMKILYDANQIHQRLKVTSEFEKNHNRTTKMLLWVILLFLLTELPSGILALLSEVLGREFFVNVYKNLWETMYVLALVKKSGNFIIYFCMSKQFRDTLNVIFRSR